MSARPGRPSGLVPWLASAVIGGGLSLPMAGGANPASAITSSPSYSATGVCVNGTSEFEFSLLGQPSEQSNQVSFALFDGPDGTGSFQTTVQGPSANVLWNPHSRELAPGTANGVAVNLGPPLASDSGAPELTPTNLAGDPAAQFGPNSDYYIVTLPTCTPGASPSIVGSAATPDGRGYWQVTSSGEVLGFGDAVYFGSMSGTSLNHPIVGMAPTPEGMGYWLVASDGGVFSFGDASFHGSTGAIKLNKPMVGMAPTTDGEGYYLVASDGGIFAFGDATFQGSTGAIHLNEPVVGLSLDRATGGYWLVASDGGVFSFDAPFLGSTGNVRLNGPIVAMESANRSGYRFVASDGGVFVFGQSDYLGSLGAAPPARPVVDVLPTSNDEGYTIIASDGSVYPFGDAQNFGSMAGATTLS